MSSAFLTFTSGLLQMVIPALSQLYQNLFNQLPPRYLLRSDLRGDRSRKRRAQVVRARDTPKRQSFPRQLFLHHHNLPRRRCHLSSLPCPCFRLCPPSHHRQHCSQCSNRHPAHCVRWIEQLWQTAGVLGDVSIDLLFLS